MTNYASLALYDAFTDRPFGGSQAAILRDAAGISRTRRTEIAREIGMPACAFVDALGDDWIEAQFLSTVMELPMCGHGTICLLTYLLDSGMIGLEAPRELELRLPATSARVSLDRRDDGRFRIMLDIDPPRFEPAPPHVGELLTRLRLDSEALSEDYPLETAYGDFVHLILPLRGLDAMRMIQPDFSGIVEFCRAYGIETVAVICTEVENAGHKVHVRDLCPAVGVSESAAAGTTNAAISSYLLRHGLAGVNQQVVEINAEQGIELGRPSSIKSRITLSAGGVVERLQVGGVASRVIDGQIHL